VFGCMSGAEPRRYAPKVQHYRDYSTMQLRKSVRLLRVEKTQCVRRRDAARSYPWWDPNFFPCVPRLGMLISPT